MGGGIGRQYALLRTSQGIVLCTPDLPSYIPPGEDVTDWSGVEVRGWLLMNLGLYPGQQSKRECTYMS